MVNCLIVGGHSGDRQRLAERFRRTGVNVGLAKDHPGSEIGDLPDMVILLEDDPGMQDCPVPVIVLESSETSARMYLPREGGLESFVDLMGCMNDPRNQSLGELAGSSHDIIWSIDGEFRFRYVSPSVERILGYRPEELLSRDFTEYLTTECQERLDRLIEDRAERPVELEFLCPSGEGRWLETSIVGSGENSFTGISREISGRKKVERECRKPAELLSATERINGRMMEGRPEKETLQYICDTLQGIEGIRNARAYLLDGEEVHCTASALEGEGELSRMILEGERPHCLQRVLDSRGTATVEEPTETCELCSLEKREGEVALVRRLEHGDRLLGVVSVLTTEDYWKGIGGFRLFEDLADTMALGLYSMELRREKERS
ncbi:MAG: PAS domain S-box protein [Methanomassiliicoccales archaeon]